MNITDVGHLTSDADTGEDKMQVAVKREHKSAWDIAKFYTTAFKENIKKLNITPPDIWCKATDHIKEQLEWIKKLEKAGFTYQTSDGIYFDTSKLKNYGELSQLKKQKLKAGARIKKGLQEKKNMHDFALWKFSPKDKKRDMEWKSKFGTGFPGWHIECTAMSTKYLGKQFDIHCGGIEHIPVHHTNEIAQTEALTKKKWVNYWVHNEHLLLGEGKMAKSGKSFVTLTQLEEKGFSPLDLRYLYLNSHYRKQLYFSWEGLQAAKTARSKLQERIKELTEEKKKGKGSAQAYKKQFAKNINDDLNTAGGLGVVWLAIKDTTIGNKEKLEFIKECDPILGLELLKVTKSAIPEKIKELAEQRLKARKEENWKKADELRAKIEKEGYIVEDKPYGYRIKQ